MQGSVPLDHRKFSRRSPAAPAHSARASRARPTTRRAAHGPRRRRTNVPGSDSRRGTGGAAVNTPTFSFTRPAASERVGQGSRAQAVVPFAALPHDIVADPRLSPTDLRV